MKVALENFLACEVKTSQGKYKVLTGKGILDRLGEAVQKANLQNRAFLFVDSAVYTYLGRKVHESLESCGIVTNAVVLTLSETNKSLDMVKVGYEWLAEQKAERSDFIVAMGGGVTGDLAGFIAATWLRGVPFVQVPTTLSAMVDASIGGKTAVNLPLAKNMVGSFHQPKLVLQDINTLKTLPKRELRSGWAEAIKHGFILDKNLLKLMENNAEEISSLHGSITEEVIRQSVSIKAQVVSEDEFEQHSTRALLNYGHTSGHAIESATGYNQFLHGEAVSIGMMVAGNIAFGMGLIDKATLDYQRHLLVEYGLPVNLPSNVDIHRVIQALQHDKKRQGSKQKWVLLKNLGEAIIVDNVPLTLVRESLIKVQA